MATNALNLGEVELPGIPVAAFNLPVTDSLEGMFFFTDGLNVAKTNFAPGKPDGVIVGAPVASDGYVTFSAATGHLQTQVPETANMTVVSIVRRQASGNTPFVGNYGPSGGVGVGLYTTDDNRIYATAGRDGAGPIQVFALGAVSTWALVVARINASGNTRIQNLTAATTASSATGNRVVSTNGPMKVGRFNEAVFAAANQSMATLFFSRVLTDGELTAIQTWAKEFADAYGVTV